MEQAEPGGGHLHDAEPRHRLGVHIEVESGLLRVEGFGAVHIGHGNQHELELQIHDPSDPGLDTPPFAVYN